MDIAFIGLGNMGSAMATNSLKSRTRALSLQARRAGELKQLRGKGQVG